VLEELKQQNLGGPDDPCEECGAPLAADQRYCLNCGHRRGGPRVDYRTVMAGAAGAPPAQQQPPQTPAGGGQSPGKEGKPQRDYAPLAAVGGIAVLGLMLLVGVLIGKGDSNPAPPAAPQVVRVGGESEEGGGEAGGAKRGSGSLTPGGKKKNAKASETDTGNAVEASQQQLEELNSESGEAAEKNALNLPNEIATPGAPPPVDKSKPPGNGEGGETIE
jgi:hypothetical protein